jgi:hypothetical protein
MHRTGLSHLPRSERNAPTGEPELDVLHTMRLRERLMETESARLRLL